MTRAIHIGENFLDTWTDLRPEELRQVQKCMKAIKDDPSTPGIKRHKLKRSKNKDLVSYYVNRDVRIIAYEPDNQRSFLLYVHHHDTAYNWAESRRIDMDSTTGGLRICPVIAEEISEETEEDEESTEPTSVLSTLIGLLPERKKGTPYFFDSLEDLELRSYGIPASYIPLIRKISGEDDVMFLLDHVPKAVGESLFALGDHVSVPVAAPAVAPASAAQEPEVKAPPPKPTEPVQEEQVVQFEKIETDGEFQGWVEALEKALELDFEKWRTFLHPVQRKAVVASSKGPIRVTGGAGTGKTVVGVHRAKHLGHNGFEKVYFITYNRTLMNNLLGMVRDVFGSELGKKYVVSTFHDFVSQRLQDNGIKVKLTFDMMEFLAPGMSSVGADAFSDRWDKESAQIVFNEIVHVIAAQGLAGLPKYLRAPRRGLGRPLSAKQKETVWAVYEAAWAEAKEKRVVHSTLLSHFANEANLPPLDGEAIVVDEVQDLQAPDLAFLGGLAPGGNQLTLLEDTKQRIYGTGYSLKSLGINVAGRRSVKLFVNYRTTKEIGDIASKTLADLALPSMEWPRALRSGDDATVKKFDSNGEELDWVIERIYECHGAGTKRIAILGRYREFLERFEARLDREGLDFAKVDRSHSTLKDGVISLCTMHSSKGLEFEVVFVVGMNRGGAGFVPHEFQDDRVLSKDYERREKHLIYVAFSRARDRLFVSGIGEDLLRLN